MSKFVSSLVARAKTLVVNAWKKNPARVVAGVASVAVVVCAKLGIVVPKQTILDALAYVVPIIGGGEVTRAVVSPAKPAVPAPVAPVAKA